MGAKLRRDEDFDRLTHNRGRGVAEDAFDSLVRPRDDAARVDLQDDVGSGIEKTRSVQWDPPPQVYCNPRLLESETWTKPRYGDWRASICSVRLSSRSGAGAGLAHRLQKYRGAERTMVLGLPRGGVVVAAEIAQALGLPLDVLVVRKLGIPWQPELAFGAIASGGETFLNRELIDREGLSAEEVARVREVEWRELRRREKAYRGGRAALDVRGWTVILVDDGVATGATMEVAIQALRRMGAGRVVVAVGVAPPETAQGMRRRADEVVCLLEPDPFGAISLWFDDFAQTTDSEVQRRLHG